MCMLHCKTCTQVASDVCNCNTEDYEDVLEVEGHQVEDEVDQQGCQGEAVVGDVLDPLAG